MKTHSTVSTKTKNMECVIIIHKKAKISTRQILFPPKTLNFDIAKNTSLKVCAMLFNLVLKNKKTSSSNFNVYEMYQIIIYLSESHSTIAVLSCPFPCMKDTNILRQAAVGLYKV